MGSPVQRFYGTEVLKISPDAVNLDRMRDGSMIPLLDSHKADSINHALGRVQKTWFHRGALMGTLRFNETDAGQQAMEMVSRGEIAGISAGYAVREWEITDSDGNVVDPETQRIRWDEEGLTFTATRWDLHEVSLVGIPADPASVIRSGHTDRAVTIDRSVSGARERMQTRQRMFKKQQRVLINE